MAKGRSAGLDMPPFPPLKRGEFHWEGRATLPAWTGFQARRGTGTSGRRSKPKSDGTVRLLVAVEDDDPSEHQPTAEQAAAFRHLLDHAETLRDRVLRAVLREYPTARRNYADDYDIESAAELAQVLPVLKRPAELNAVIELTTLHFSPVTHAGRAYVGFEFECNWEEEHGLGVLTHAGRVVAVGPADVAFSEEDAEADARKQKRKRKKKKK